MKNLIEELRACAKMHPLDIDLDVLLESAEAIEQLTYAVGLVAFNVDEEKELSLFCLSLYMKYKYHNPEHIIGEIK